MYCRRCGTSLPQGLVICPECGARQGRQVNSVRCSNCHGRVPVGLTVCPHCGRDARPAGPRWGLWAAGALVAVLVILLGLDKLPTEQIREEITGVRSRLSSLVQVLGPVTQDITQPMQPLGTPQAIALITDVPVGTTSEPGQPTAEIAMTPTVEDAPVTGPTSSVTDTTKIGTPTAGTQEATATATVTPADLPTPTPTWTQTASPTPAPPTATPTATKAPVAKATPTASKNTVYRVQSGDSPYGIAQQFGVSLDALLAANHLTAKSVLRVGQELVIPVSGASIPSTATPRPWPTATPSPQPPTPTPSVSLAAPVLINPGDQASYSGDKAQIELKWEAVPGIVAGNQYRVIIRWIEGGVPQEHPFYWTSTTMPVPPWVWGHADQPTRKYTWFVQVVQVTTDGQGGQLDIPLSPASLSRDFYWN